MKAVGLTRYLPIENPESLLDVELPDPKPTGRDLLVRIKAIAVNPVDCKVRAPKEKVEGAPRILGWDAAGEGGAAGSGGFFFRTRDRGVFPRGLPPPGGNAEPPPAGARLHAPRPH